MDHFTFDVFDVRSQDAVFDDDRVGVGQAFVFRTQHGGDGRVFVVESEALDAHEQFAHIVVDHPEPLRLAQEGDQVVIAYEVKPREFSSLFFQVSE